jgi:SAM-dependent methyltransferase
MTSLLDQFGVSRLKDYWVRLALRGVHYASRPRKLDALYMVENPWELDSAKEQARFAWTNRIVSTYLSPVDSILEIGCGEGHQSQHLSSLCGRLYGIDVSPRAVQRARRRCPNGRFAAGDPSTFDFADLPLPVDLVVACEMLYYVKDIPQFLARISGLGRVCLVTYYQGHVATLDPHFGALADCERERFCFDGTEWNAVWWRNDATHKSAGEERRRRFFHTFLIVFRNAVPRISQLQKGAVPIGERHPHRFRIGPFAHIDLRGFIA